MVQCAGEISRLKQTGAAFLHPLTLEQFSPSAVDINLSPSRAVARGITATAKTPSQQTGKLYRWITLNVYEKSADHVTARNGGAICVQ
jgi:hypothetical protein